MDAAGLVGVIALVGLVGSGEAAKPTVSFRLQDHRGAWHTLDEARDREVVVLAFLGAECPLAEAYAPRLAAVARDFEKRGVGFFGVDVLAIWWAFRINNRTARACEEITVTPSELRVRRTSHRGHVVEWVLNPLWVRLDQKTDPEFGIERLYLVSRGRLVSIGSFLGPDEKASFAKALLAALQAAKRGPTYNPVS